MALEAADDLGLALPLGGAPSDVVEGGLVSPHADDDHAVEGGIRLPVAASIEAVPGGLAAEGRDRAGAAELGEGRLRMDALGIIADEDEHLGGGARAYAVGLNQFGCDLLGQLRKAAHHGL